MTGPRDPSAGAQPVRGDTGQHVDLNGRVVIVTGGGRGLGRAHARLLGECGARVLVSDAGVSIDGTGASPVEAAGVAEAITTAGGEAEANHADLSTRAGCESVVVAALERFGRLDAIVHSAGLTAYGGIEATDDETFARLMAVNATAPFRLCRAAWPHFRAQGYGRIVLTLSSVGLNNAQGFADMTAYAVGKAAQLGLMRGLGAEGEPHGIRVNAISPVAATRMFLSRDGTASADPRLAAELVSPAVAFLASAACERSGLLIRALGGRFALDGYASGDELDLGPTPAAPDQIAQMVSEAGLGAERAPS